MASASGQDSRWYLTAELLQNSPSRRCGMDQDQELNHRQNAAYLIQDMGQRLRVSQLCINTAIVYMHRFYAYHSFTYFHRNGIAAASLFLAAKVEEQPRKLETVIHIANACTASFKFNEVPDPSKESYQEQAQDLVFNENVLLQTLGFDVAVDHPHTHVVKTCHLVKACKDLAHTSYFLASNSLHLTTMCLQYKPTVVACFCIYLACKWSGWEIPQSTEGKFWFHYVDTNVNLDLLEQLTREFLVIYEKSPARLKTKLNSCKGLVLNKQVESPQQRSMSQPSNSSRSHPAGEHSRSQSSSHQRANHQKIPHAGQPGKEHLPSKSSSSSTTSGQMPSKQPHSNVAPASAPSASASSSSSAMVSNSCRPRPERSERPIVPEPHFSAPQRTAGSTKGPLPPLTRGNIDNMTQSGNAMQATVLQQQQQQQQQQRSSQPSHDQQYYQQQQQQQANKSRNPMNSMTQPIPDMQRQNLKPEQRQHGKDQQQPKPIDPTKNQVKPQQQQQQQQQQQHSSGNNSGNLYSTNENQQRMSSTSRQPPYQQQLPNYNQAMASRKVNHPQQQQPQPEHASVHQLKHPTTESAFRLTDDQCGPMVDGHELSSPPKQHKSIFSPEWNDSVNVVPQRPANNGLRSQLCINTAIVYMHRFYAYHSFTYFHRNGIAAASLFLAAKVEEQPRKLETVIHIANACTASFKFNEVPDPSKESYQEQAQDLVFNENVLLQTLGFDVAVDHPHTHVVKTCHLVKACKDLAQTSYFLASNSLHLTTMCLQYKPTVVACFCIYLACKWSGWEIPQSTEGKFWFHYVDTNVNLDLLEQLTREFLVIYEKSPARLKTKLNSCKGLVLNKQVESPQQRSMSQPSNSSRSHPAGEHSRSQSSSHQRANHQKIPHAGQPGKEHLPSKSSSSSTTSGQMPSKQPHSNVAPASAPSASASSSSSAMVSNSCRPRPERSERPIVPEPHFSAPQRTAGSTKGPLPPLTRGNIDNMTQSGNAMQATVLQQQQQQQQQQRSSQPSHDQQYYQQQQQQQANKSRNPMNSMTQPIPDMQRQNLKPEQRQHGKDQQQPKPIDPTKNQVKPQQQQQQQQQQQHSSGNNSGNLYSTNENQQRMSSTSRQPPYQQQLPNYNQAMASRKVNHPQQQQPQPEHASVHQLKHPTTESAFRLTDDQCGPMVDGHELSSPPKQHKSIFSPEWNDIVNVVPQRPANNGLNIKSNRDSPKKHRSETPKKDKRNDSTAAQLGNKAPSHSDKRGNGAKSGLPAMTVPQQNVPFDSTSTIAKHLNAGLKRMLPDDAIKQENGIDFREAKQRKLDVGQPMSPSFSLDFKPSLVDVKPNISKMPTYQAENVYDHPMKTSSFNGIETNPDLVSSLLKESLCTDAKFQSSLSTVAHETIPQSLIKSEPSKYESFEPSATLPQQLFETPMLPTQIKLEAGSEHGQRIKSEKKKKKDKHKHKDKDKDKTKDREERKKHKKDKDRQKDRERSAEQPPATDGHNPLKITIPRDKLITTQEQPAPGGFKITIPRDRIKPEQTVPPPPASLKIKISKDLIGDYASGQQQNNPAEIIQSNSHSHSSKKKDKERDRDKSKNSKHLPNGSNGNGSNSNGGNATVTSANSRNQSSNANKMIPQYNNIHPQTQYMQHSQYMQQQPQQKMPPYSGGDPMGASNLYNSVGQAGGNVNQMPPNRLPPQPLQPQQQPQSMPLQQQHQLQQQLNQSQQSMIDATKYSNHYPFAGNTNYFYHGGNSNSSSNNNVNKKN